MFPTRLVAAAVQPEAKIVVVAPTRFAPTAGLAKAVAKTTNRALKRDAFNYSDPSFGYLSLSPW